jgi:small subunit ribosomal protein S20
MCQEAISLDKKIFVRYLIVLTLYKHQLTGEKILANHKSALKRARQSQAARLRNMTHKSKAKSAVKEVRTSLEANNVEQVKETLKKTVSTLQKAVSKGVIHKKKAARKVSRLAKAVNRAAAQKAS